MSSHPEPTGLVAEDRTPRPQRETAEAWQRLAELGLQAVGSQASTLVFIDREARKLVMAASVGFGRGEWERNIGRPFSLGTHKAGDVFDFDIAVRGEVIEKHGLQTDGQGVFDPEVAQRYGLNSLLALPLDSARGVLGYICHFTAGNEPFTSEQKSLAANQAMLAIEILEKYSGLDPLLEMSETLSRGLLLAPPG